jgi:hypothetical protein
MSIVSTVIESDAVVGQSRKIVYVCQDNYGKTYRIGPVFTDEQFDEEAAKLKIAANLETRLAEVEAEQVLGDS